MRGAARSQASMPDTILVVDDEPYIRQLLEEKLQKEGYDTRAAASAERAIEEIGRTRFGVVLTDIRMEGMDGMDLTREIKSRSPETEVILVTAVNDIQAAVTATKLGAHDYIRKPFDLEEMVLAVRSALEHRWLKLERKQYQRDLQKKVRDRTRQLEERNATLAGLQDEISHMEKLSSIGVLAASVSHEVNNPLSSIIGFAELLAEMDDISDEARKYARVIYLEGQKIHKLTEQLLDMSRQGKIEKKVQDMNEVVVEVLSVTDHHLSRFKNVEIETALHDGSLRCNFDRSQIQQILLNLFLNAAQAMSDGGQLLVRTWEEKHPELGPGVSFSVSDSGPGISSERLKEIFKPFVTTKEKGTGLGLKICADIVKAHGGAIDVDSELGRGTTFKVWIPNGPSGDLHERQELQTEGIACRG